MNFNKLFRGISSAGFHPKSGIIYGCTEKTFIWWHEKAHFLQFKNKIIGELMNAWTIALVLVFTYVFQIWVLVLFYPVLIFALEIDAYIYAIYKYLIGEVKQ